MKINGKSITGLFIYDESATYERNDLVVKDTTIYVCSPVNSDSVYPGEDPESSENYYIYLCDKFETTEGFLNGVENGKLDVKACSVDTLQSILNHFMVGIDSKGIIGDGIELSPTGEYKLKIGNREETSLPSNYKNILSELMTGDEVNNGIFKVSGNLPEIQLYSLGDYCILKQYTTKFNNIRVRTQELIDPFSGLIYFRAIKGTEIPGPFKCSVIKSNKLKEQVDKMSLVYSRRLNYINSLEESLKRNFRYKSISVPTGSFTIQFEKNPGIITLLFIKTIQSGVYENFNLTLDLSLKYPGEDRWPKYSIFNGSNLLEISKENQSDDIDLFLTFRISGNESEKISISDLIYREYYGN